MSSNSNFQLGNGKKTLIRRGDRYSHRNTQEQVRVTEILVKFHKIDELGQQVEEERLIPMWQFRLSFESLSLPINNSASSTNSKREGEESK